MEFLLLLMLPLLALGFGGDDAGSDPQDETLSGTDGDDIIAGGSGDDSVVGLNGEDFVDGRAGDDALYGGAGNDVADGGLGDDYVSGGTGNDLVAGWTGDDTLDGGTGHDVVLGDAGNDFIRLGWGNDRNWLDDELSADGFANGQLGDDSVFGGNGNDSIWDYSGKNILDGGDGNDEISSTDNQLQGWETAAHASDSVNGGAGDDTVVGDDGDTLSGGLGNDTMVVLMERDNDAPVTITDFDGSHDTLDLAVDETLADPVGWSLFHSTNAATGNVTVGVVNDSDASQKINLAVLQKPLNFDFSNVVAHRA